MDLKTVVTWLAENNYLVMHKNRYLLTSKFNKEISGEDIGIQVIEKPVVKQVATPIDWVALYQKLIIESGMPRMSDNGRGGEYQINIATKPGREAFKKAILQDKETYESLLAKVKAYYLPPKSYAVKLERFFVDEIWKANLKPESNGIRPTFK